MKSPILLCAMVLTLSLGTLSGIYADSATWNTNPISNDWNTAQNWTPNTVPNGPDDIATFGLSRHTGVLVSTDIEVSEVIFNAGASPFTINAAGYQELTISGIGITNNSGIAQNFVFPNFARILLTNNATAADMTFFTLKGGHGNKNSGGFASFSGNASAGNGTFVLEPPETPNAYRGGSVTFDGNSTADNGTFMAQFDSFLSFDENSSAANGTFIVDGGRILFGGKGIPTPTAGNGLFIINSGGVTFYENTSAGNATLIANPGVNGGEGGRISFENLANDGGEARIELFGNGTLDIEYGGFVVSVGSIEGDGIVFLGEKELITGTNDLSTTFSGTIQDSGDGSLEKIGNGTLSLRGSSTYIGGTSVSGGVLKVANTTGSATGTGPVSVDVGTLSGNGIIGGAVVLGTGTGAGAVIAPSGQTDPQPGTLTINGNLTFNSDSTYSYSYSARANRARTAMVIANGVTINSGATLDFNGTIHGRLTPGLVFTVIKNTSANPISGAFSNLPDGSTIVLAGNTLQASYEGGDGNDLTLTVVP